MSWNDPLDIYCERLSPEFWAEPLNALTNVAFIVAGLALIWHWGQRLTAEADRGRRFKLYVLSCNMLLIGVGSFLFHSVAVKWSLWADVIPIFIFMSLGMYWAFRSWLFDSRGLAALGVLGFHAVGFTIEWSFPGAWNGSVSYFHASLGLWLWWLYLRGKGNQHASAWVGAAALVFSVSIAFRSLDQMLCPVFPLGTHFMWHLLNSTTLYCFSYALLCPREVNAQHMRRA